jgi:DNA adenine methylase
MDPPYQGTSFTRDHRYLHGLSYEDFVKALSQMNDKSISYIISYDGVTGNKEHGKSLPKFLSLKHLHIHAGRSSQATLLGSNDETIESLYLSPALVERLETKEPIVKTLPIAVQQELAFA